MTRRGILITADGLDRAGTAAALDALGRWIERRGHRVEVVPSQPSAMVRRAAASRRTRPFLDARVAALLGAADIEHGSMGPVRAGLDRGSVVLFDRYAWTSIARGVARGLEPSWARSLYRFLPRPDISIYLRQSAADAMRQTLAIVPSDGALTAAAGSYAPFLERVVTQLDELAAAAAAPDAEPWPVPTLVIDAGRSSATTGSAIRDAVRPLLASPRRGRSSVPGQPLVRAAIDCGSNSVHLLVGVVENHRVRPLADQSTFLTLGAAAADGELGAALIDHLVATMVGYVGLARGLGAEDVVAVGTEPFRRATDARHALAQIRSATRIRVAVISHTEEALLTLIGVTGGRRVNAGLLVCDVGGGSTELAVLGPRRRPAAFGVRAGSAVLTERIVRHDPPTTAELRALRDEAARLVAVLPSAPRGRLVAVGGSATNLLRVLPVAGLDMVLTRARLDEISETLATEPAAVAAQRHRVSPTRARLLPAGAAILDAIMARYATDQLEVSQLGIREGIMLATSQPGGPWRRRLRQLAAGWGPALAE